jgi:hypothetical protein
MSALEIIKAHTLENQSKADEIERLQDLIEESKERLVDTFLAHFVSTPIAFIEAIAAEIGGQLTQSLIIKVAQARPLTSSDLTFSMLHYVENMTANNHNIFSRLFEPHFNDLSIQDKLKVATFNSGYSPLFKQHSYMHDWLAQEFGIVGPKLSNGNNIDLSDEHEINTKQSIISVSLHRNKTDDLHEKASIIVRFVTTGYRANVISLLEHTLSVNVFYQIIVNRDDNGSLLGFALEQGRFAEPKCFNGTPEQQMLQLLQYCSKHHWYNDSSD